MDFFHGKFFHDVRNKSFIEINLSQEHTSKERSYILLWGYLATYHSFFVEMAKKFIISSGSRYEPAYKFVIHPKFDRTYSINQDLYRQFAQILAFYFEAIKRIPNPDQVLLSHFYTYIEQNLILESIGNDQSWHIGTDFEEKPPQIYDFSKLSHEYDTSSITISQAPKDTRAHNPRNAAGNKQASMSLLQKSQGSWTVPSTK